MKGIQTITLVCLLTLIAVSVARGQEPLTGPSDGPLMLYRLDGVQGKYLLTMSFEKSEKVRTSFVVIGDTFSVHSIVGGCKVVMSNVYILQTTYRPIPSNEVVQIKFRTDAYSWSFPKSTKLVLDSSVVDLPNVKVEAPAGVNTKTYEGRDALKQLRKMGLKPPDDIDIKKAVGHDR